jgi:hypothetical protein
MGSTLGPNSGPRAGVILTHPNSFPPPFLLNSIKIQNGRRLFLSKLLEMTFAIKQIYFFKLNIEHK